MGRGFVSVILNYYSYLTYIIVGHHSQSSIVSAICVYITVIK